MVGALCGAGNFQYFTAFFPPCSVCMCRYSNVCGFALSWNNLLFLMHFSQRDSADSWLEVVTEMGNYYGFIIEEVYKK